MNLAEKINLLMKKSHIKNPKELSERLEKQNLKIPYTTLLTIINDEVQDIKLGTARKLCDFFHITLDELLDDNITLSNFRYIEHDGINTDGLDQSDLDEINRFVEFVKNKRKEKNSNNKKN